MFPATSLSATVKAPRPAVVGRDPRDAAVVPDEAVAAGLGDREVDVGVVLAALAAARVPAVEGHVLARRRAGIDEVRGHRVHRAREVRARGGDHALAVRVEIDIVVGEPAVVRALHDDVARLLLVVGEQHRVLVQERHPLAVGEPALGGVAVALRPARGDAVGVVGRGGGREAGQRAEARVGVLELALAVALDPEGQAAVAAAARALLAARLLADQVELVAAVHRDLRVLGGVGEAGRAAGDGIAVVVDADLGLGLVALRVGGDARGEGQALGVRGGQGRPRRRRARWTGASAHPCRPPARWPGTGTPRRCRSPAWGR